MPLTRINARALVLWARSALRLQAAVLRFSYDLSRLAPQRHGGCSSMSHGGFGGSFRFRFRNLKSRISDFGFRNRHFRIREWHASRALIIRTLAVATPVTLLVIAACD